MKSVKQFFRTTQKLIKDQVEITGLSTIDWNQPMWRESSVLCDRAVHIMKSQTYVFAGSVLCLGGISTAPVQAWDSRINWFLVTRYLKDQRGIDGIRMENCPMLTFTPVYDCSPVVSLVAPASSPSVLLHSDRACSHHHVH